MQAILLWTNKFSMQFKMFTMFAVATAACLVFFVTTISISKRNETQMNTLVETRLPVIEISGRLAQAINTIRVKIVQNAISQNVEGYSGLAELHAAVQKEFVLLKGSDKSDLEKIEELEKRYQVTFKASSTLLEDVIAGIETLAKAQLNFQKYTNDFTELEKQIAAIKEAHEKDLRASVEKSKANSQMAVAFGFAILVCAIPFGFGFFQMVRSITRKLNNASFRLEEASDKILRIAATAQVSSHQLAATSSQQASSVQESAASMEQMRTMLGQTAQHSGTALNSSETSFQEANNGKDVVERLRDAMKDIERSWVELEEVNLLVRDIQSKTNIINEIVFKTQLLSFNASIEAARAGVHGRGFAVVAEEVGKLAVMSGAAASEIEGMLDHSTRRVADTVQRTKQKVDAANGLSQECAEMFERINERTAQTKSMVSFIRHATVEQSAGIQNVSQAMDHLNKAATETSTMAHSISNLSTLLKDESGALATTVSKLNQLVRGGEIESTESDEVSDEETEQSDQRFVA